MSVSTCGGLIHRGAYIRGGGLYSGGLYSEVYGIVIDMEFSRTFYKYSI